MHMCIYIAYMHVCVYIHRDEILMEAHRDDKHYIAVFYVPLDSYCCKLCLSVVVQSLLYSIYLALGTITVIPPTAFLNFVGGYFVVG